MPAPASFRGCPMCLDDEEADESPPVGRRPAEEQAAATRLLRLAGRFFGRGGGEREVPVKLRHLKVAAERGTWRPCIFWPRSATTVWRGSIG